MACRALVELQRAMQENSIARCPILGAQHEGSAVSLLSKYMAGWAVGTMCVQASLACPSFAAACCACSSSHTVMPWLEPRRHVCQCLTHWCSADGQALSPLREQYGDARKVLDTAPAAGAAGHSGGAG